MVRLWMRSRCVLTTMVLFAGIGGSAKAATVALKAVAVNGSSIPTSSVVNVAPGDRVTCEIRISDFADIPGIKTYQTTIEALGWVSGDSGALIPIGWDAPLPTGQDCTTSADCAVDSVCLVFPQGICGAIFCATKADCPSGLTCACHISGCSSMHCVGPAHTPADGAFIDTDNPRFVHFGVMAISAVSVSVSRFIFGSTVFDLDDATVDTGVSLYAGTVDFRISDSSDALSEASGTFVLGFRNGLDNTFIQVPDPNFQIRVIPFDVFSPLTVNVAPLEEIIPTTSTWGLVILALLLACMAKIAWHTKPRRRLVA